MTQINGSTHTGSKSEPNGTVEKKPVVAESASVLRAIDGYDKELRAINKKVYSVGIEH